MVTHKAAILTIGTEITDGDLVNANAAWIASELNSLGLKVVLHQSVPDVFDSITKALSFCQTTADLTVITGGLGPTSDDLTREVLAKFIDSPLVFHEPSWMKIKDYFKSLDTTPVESNKKQCYFPEGAKILVNKVGTANAFALEYRTHQFFVLPGPPREIESIWPQIHEYLSPRIKKNPKHNLVVYQTIGIGESIIAEKVEELLAKKPWTLGYRSHFPIVEIKVWCPKSDETELDHLLGSTLKPWLLKKGKSNHMDELVGLIRQKGFKTVKLFDQTGSTYVSKKFFDCLEHGDTEANYEFNICQDKSNPGPVARKEQELFLNIREKTSTPTSSDPKKQFLAKILSESVRSETVIQLPQRDLPKRRLQAYVGELAIKFWGTILSK